MAKSELITAPKTLDATPGQQVEMREKNMGEKLRAISDEWLGIHRRRLTDDIKVYWHMANQVREIVSHPDVYGHDAAKTLLSRHNMDTVAVREFLLVSQTLDQEFVDAMVAYNLSPASQFGLVTAHHMRLLAKEPSTRERKKLWTAITKQKLSIRDTIARLKENKDIGEDGVDDLAKRRVVAVLGMTVKSAGLLQDNLETVCAEAFIESIQKVKEEDLKNAVKTCNDAIERMQEICEAGIGGITMLENARDRLVQRFDQAAAHAAAQGREMKVRKTTSKRKLASEADAADGGDDFADDDTDIADDVITGIVTSKKVTPVSLKSVAAAAKPEKTAVYKNPKKRLQAQAAASVTEELPSGEPAVAKPAKPAVKLVKVNNLRKPKAST